MKHSSLALACLFSLFTAFGLSAQSPGKVVISAATGVITTYAPSKTEVNTLPLSLRLGYDFTKHFHLGAYIGYSAATSNPRTFADGMISRVENKSFMAGIRGELRRDLSKRVNIYGGLLLGYNHIGIKEYDARTGARVVRDPESPSPYDPNAPEGQLLYAGFIGSTYKIYKELGVFAEAGYGISLLNMGLTIKF